MLLEVDEVAIDRKLWEDALAGNKAARFGVAEVLSNLELYMHNFSVSDEELGQFEVVTLREIETKLNLELHVKVFFEKEYLKFLEEMAS